MQLSSKKRGKRPATLVDLGCGEHGVISRIELPEGFSRRLMELGFLPGGRVKAVRSAPGGDPRVFEVDGSQVALRRETARHICIEGDTA